MDTKQISGDMPFSGTVAFEWEATLIEIIFALKIQCVQLQPVLFKWPDPCLAIHFHSPSTLDFLLMRRSAHILCGIGVVWLFA
jgi:hypothetical protein